jgi:hypothetical protein
MRRYVQFTGLLAIAISATIGIYAIADDQNPVSPEEQMFRDALQGNFSEIRMGHGVRDDVIGIIKKQGSILDGSVLDPRRSGDETNSSSEDRSKKAFAAEQMLKASRWLENIGPADSDRADLVNRMRAEAAKLLSE